MLSRKETEIVVAAKAGNRTAFKQLVLRYQNLITSLAYSRTGDLQRSEDIAQQAFLTAWQKRSELQDPARFAGWLRSITRNITLNSNRKSNRLDRSAESLSAASEPVTDLSPADSAMTSEQQQLLWDSLNNIPEQYREPLVLFYREDKSVAQVAELLELSVDATKQRLARGRAMLKSEVEKFVEDLLGASRPDVSFTSAVMLALPSTVSSVGGKAVVQGAAATGAKSMLSKLGLSFSGPMLGVLGGLAGGAVGIAGAYYGTKKATEHATSSVEVELIWNLFRKIMAMTVGFTAVSLLVAFYKPLEHLQKYVVVWGTVGFAGLLSVFISRFTQQQRKLHAIHGRPAYMGDVGEQKAASVKELRGAMIGSTFGCWAWLIVLAAVEKNWIVCAVALVTMLANMAFRWISAAEKTTIVDQLKWSATYVLSNAMQAAVVLMLCGLIFGLQYHSMPNWGMALMILVIGWFVAAMIWVGANKAQAKAEQNADLA